MKALFIFAVVIMFTAFAINGILYVLDTEDKGHRYE
jgi:hypothetical protein